MKKQLILALCLLSLISCNVEEVKTEEKQLLTRELPCETDTQCAEEAVRYYLENGKNQYVLKITCTITEINSSTTSGHTFHIGSGRCSNGRIFHFTAYEETITIEWQNP